jgi:hypothetical protein
MIKTQCENCDELSQRIEIRRSGQLSQAIRVVRENLADGTIVESAYWPAGILQIDQPDFSFLNEAGPWDDVLAYYFECATCSQKYCLSAETYHGSGGVWEPIDADDL